MTGYCAMLEQRKFDVLEWLRGDVIKAFGIAYRFRDDNFDGTEVEAKLKKDLQEDVDRYQKELEDDELALCMIKNMSLKEFIDIETESAKETIKKRTKDVVENQKMADTYLDVIRKLKAIQACGKIKGELAPNMITFALEQVTDTLHYDYERPYAKEDIARAEAKLKFTQKEWRELYKDMLDMRQTDVKRSKKRLQDQQEKMKSELNVMTEFNKEFAIVMKILQEEAKNAPKAS